MLELVHDTDPYDVFEQIEGEVAEGTVMLRGAARARWRVSDARHFGCRASGARLLY